jgi:voltage-gated potassium channel
MSKARAYIHRLLDAHDGGRGLEKFFKALLIGLVLLNATAVVLGSVQSLYRDYQPIFVGIEFISVYVFTLEYGLRVWSCVEDRRFRQPIRGRLRFILTPMALIDLFAILPFYLSFGFVDLRVLRLLRLFRLLKVARYVRALHLIGHVIRRKRAELLVTTGLIGLMLVVVSSIMFFVEHEAQPDKFGSIPETMWWGVATLTTVGYGDVYPITVAGKVLSSVIAVLGLGLFALPTGILAAGFSEHLAQQRAATEVHTYCPHCGHKL